MHTSLSTRIATRLSALSIAFVMTLVMLVSVDSLASHEAQLALMADNAPVATATTA